jgi:hypothetical protein
MHGSEDSHIEEGNVGGSSPVTHPNEGRCRAAAFIVVGALLPPQTGRSTSQATDRTRVCGRSGVLPDRSGTAMSSIEQRRRRHGVYSRADGVKANGPSHAERPAAELVSCVGGRTDSARKQ